MQSQCLVCMIGGERSLEVRSLALEIWRIARPVFYIDQTCRQTGLSRSAKTPTRPAVSRSG